MRLLSHHFKIWLFWNLYFKIWPDENCYNQNLMRSETLISKSNALFSLYSKSDALIFLYSKSDMSEYFESKFNSLFFLYSKSGASKFSSIPNLTRCKTFNSKPDAFFFEVRRAVFFSGQLLTYRKNLNQNHFFKKLEKT